MEEVKDQKIKAYFTPAVPAAEFIIGHDPLRYEEGKCKPEHKVDGIVPFQEDIRFDGRSCDCGRVKFIAELCGCDMKEYRLKKIPNE